jgi:myo-inositol-1(or 4)-monophosphatase
LAASDHNAHLDDILSAAEKGARAGGKVLLEWLGKAEVRAKGPSDFVTQADLASQETVRQILAEQFPEIVFLGEESTDFSTAALEGTCWVVDPLDGTTNFVHQIPQFAVSVGYIENGIPAAGVIFDPISGECYMARRGGGSFLRGKPIHVSEVNRLEDAVAAASFAAKVHKDSLEIRQFVNVLLNCQAARRTGSAALNMAYVAAGRFDVFWGLSTKAWDVAAGIVIVEEAGGVISRTDGLPLQSDLLHIAASASQPLHEEFIAALKASG